MKNLYTTREVAELIGCCTESVSRHARNLELGERISQLRVFTKSEVNKLKKVVRDKPGNPGGPRVKKKD